MSPDHKRDTKWIDDRSLRLRTTFAAKRFPADHINAVTRIIRDSLPPGEDLISDALPFGRLWYDGPDAAANAIGYAEHYSRSHDAVIRVYDASGNVIETHQHKGAFQGAVAEQHKKPPRRLKRNG